MVDYIQYKVPYIIKSHSEIDIIMFHVCTNDIPKQQSKLLKRDFVHLLNLLKSFKGKICISGPIPTYGCGMGCLSRLISMNTWLSSACDALSVDFIDNFNIFWERGELFGPDGLHSNTAAV